MTGGGIDLRPHPRSLSPNGEWEEDNTFRYLGDSLGATRRRPYGIEMGSGGHGARAQLDPRFHRGCQYHRDFDLQDFGGGQARYN